jgi:transcriptional regulator NrdR family protein
VEPPITTDKFCCPHCGAWKSRVVDSRPDHEGLQFLRWRICRRCHQLFETAERVTGKTMALPALRVDGGDQSPPT